MTRRIKQTAICAIGLSVALLAVPAALAAGGTRQPTDTTPEAEPRSTAETAIEHYNRGLSMRDRAWKLTEKLEAETNPAKRGKLEKKVRAHYRDASREFEQAVTQDPSNYRAFSELGYASRRLGEYTAALAAYERALSIEPGYVEAIEYRAEAYLGLNRLDEAKESYLLLFGEDRDRADELLDAMRRWVASRREDPSGVSADTIDGFAEWVEEREQLAGQTARLAPGATRSW